MLSVLRFLNELSIFEHGRIIDSCMKLWQLVGSGTKNFITFMTG